MRIARWYIAILLVLLATAGSAQAQMTDTELRLKALEDRMDGMGGSDSSVNYDSHGVKTTPSVRFNYGKKGFHFETGNGLFSTNLQWRAQMRFSGINRGDPRSPGNFSANDVSNFEGRRLRMKIGGHGYKPWIKYYFEVDTQPSRSVNSGNDRSRIIDWRLDVQPWEEFGIRVGQWKINYNRERVDSSGRQQFVERSIVNRQFTIDRQVGVMAQGRLFKGTLADVRYYAGVFNGEGRATNNPDDNFMYMGRVQWNFLGRDLKWRQSDVKRHRKPTGSLAFAAAQNTGTCTRWSSSGCGNLSAFTSPTAAIAAGQLEQFNIDQYVQEFAFKWNGLSLQQEYHWKNIQDSGTVAMTSGRTHSWEGAYGQVGYFFNEIFSAVPEGLEVAFRYAFTDETDASAPQRLTIPQNHRKEYTWAVNYFIAGHNNKLTFDVSYLTLRDASSGLFYDDERVRLQWDISF